MKLTKRVRLYIPKELESKFFQFIGASRFAYNWALKEDANLDISESKLRSSFTIFKKKEENKWLYDINNDVLKQSIRDYCNAKGKYFKKLSRRPALKKKGKCNESFYIDVEKIKILDNDIVQIPSIGKIKYSGYKLPLYQKRTINKITVFEGVKPSNPRVTYDGIHWWLSVAYEVDIKSTILNNTSIGVDLGLKEFATICIHNTDNNSEEFYEVESLKSKYKKLAKRKKRLDRKISKRVLENKKKGEVTKSNNYLKLIKKRLKLTQRITNIQKDNIYDCISFMVKSKPKRIVIENLNIKGMMKNKKLAKWIAFNQFYEFRRILQYKCDMYGIELIIADRYFPSSKKCSCCGNIKSKLSLSERTYICDNCKLILDRDMNAALNLSLY